MTTQIENLLSPRDPTITEENDWEEFALTDVKVHIPGKARYANLLSASEDNPVCVTGQLELVEKDQESLVLDPAYRSKRVLIGNVTHYAYGQHENGEVGIWVAGQAGWFSITPAKGYKPMFNEMVEAIDLLYFLADKHQRKGRRGRKWNPKLGYLFDEYTRHTNGACEDAEDSAETFYKHHVFLIDQMVQGRENVDWTSTPLCSHLRQKYPDVFMQAETRFVGVDDETVSDEDSNEDTGSPEAADEARAQADTVFEAILDMKESGLLSKRQLSMRGVADTLLKRYEMSSLEYALDLIRARAGFLIEMMDQAQTSTFGWSRTAIYRELKAAKNSECVHHMSATPLHPRPSAQESPSLPSEEGSEEDIPLPKRRGRRVRKSLLRPKLSSVSTKGAGKRNREAEVENTDSEEDLEDTLNEETPTKARGHQLVHDPLSTKVNESTRSIFSDSDATSMRKTPMQDTFNIIKASNLPVVEKSAIRPHSTADLPRDTWVCSVQGCGKVVYKASLKRSKEAIQDHSLAHAEDTQTKLDLVFAEQRHNVNISVSHLVSRIRDFGALQETGEVALASSYPKRPKLGGFNNGADLKFDRSVLNP